MSVIYEKHYPHPSFEEIMKEYEKYEKEWENSPDYKPEPVPSFEEFYKNMLKNRTLILLPGKMQKAEKFIKLAIEISEYYEIDAKISREEDHISVNYSFDDAGDMAFLIPLFRQIDSISFFTGIYGFENTVSLDYYTHAVFDKGRLLYPRDFEKKCV